jgi:2-polyprenyl-6-methoxyphenol hydroxylase-like FAD-dependent oxidoreductase
VEDNIFDGMINGTGESPNKSVLISGAGIAGPALAYWLALHGFMATLIEAAPGPRTGGYVMTGFFRLHSRLC